MKLETANRVLATFAANAEIYLRGSRLRIKWPTYGGRLRDKEWQCRRGQDFYPKWSQQWCGGGTSCTALSQLVRWIQGKPVLPLGTWRHWASESVQLLPIEAVNDLATGGYPDISICVLCDNPTEGLDWWNLDGVSGPCCSFTRGCRQKPMRVPA